MQSLSPRWSAPRLAWVFAAACAAGASGDDFAAPYYRGMPLSVHASWEFATSQTPYGLQPDMFSTVAGPPKYQYFSGTDYPGNPARSFYFFIPSNWAWTSGPDGDGAWTAMSGTGEMQSDPFEFDMGNWLTDKEQVVARVQITCRDGAPRFWGLNTYGNGSPYPFHVDFWQYSPTNYVADITFTGNPDYQMMFFWVPKGASLDSVVFDSVSIPGPGACMLLGCAGVLAARRSAR